MKIIKSIALLTALFVSSLSFAGATIITTKTEGKIGSVITFPSGSHISITADNMVVDKETHTTQATGSVKAQVKTQSGELILITADDIKVEEQK
jgi:lipopolysaccharide assembly outer membrane protein LptD (OstA)